MSLLMIQEKTKTLWEDSEMDSEDKPTIWEFWRVYNIKKAIDNIIALWDEITPATMNGV